MPVGMFVGYKYQRRATKPEGSRHFAVSDHAQIATQFPRQRTVVKWNSVFVALIIGSIGLLLSGCGNIDTDKFAFFYPPYRYALQAEVETPEGIRFGSSVIEVKWSYSSFTIKGEAVAVDLPNGQTLFVLLRSSSSDDWAAYAHEWTNIKAPPNLSADEANEIYWKMAADDRGTYPVKRQRMVGPEEIDNYPYFVRFRDIRDPTSIERVDPDDLAATFGPGYRLKSLTAQFTDASVTTGIERKLPSFGAETGFANWYRELPYGDPRAVTRDDFVKGL